MFSSMKQSVLISVGLIILTFVALGGVLDLQFVSYDDPDYITSNHLVQQGLTFEGLSWAFGRIHGTETYWHPITWVTHMFDCQFFGLNPKGHHLTSLLFHAGNVVLLFIFLNGATKSPWTSAAIAGLFAVHPLQVESIAWVTERKNLVSTFFSLLTLISYSRFITSKKVGRYILTLVLFALALMSKPAVVTLPCVMLLLDFWPFRRMTIFDQNGRVNLQTVLKSKSVFVEKIPFLLLSMVSSTLTLAAHQDLGMLAPATKPPLELSLGNIFVSYVTYIRKFFLPNDLAVFYPFPTSIPISETFGCIGLLAAITFFAIFVARKSPYVTVGWFWFVGVLVPMTGIVHVGIQAMADRFMYLPIIGLLVAICFGVRNWLANKKFTWGAGAVVTGGALVICVAVARAQVPHWKNDYEMFEHARQVTKDNYMAYTAVGGIYLRQGDFDRAMTNFAVALEIRPTFPDIHLSLGYAMLYRGRFSDAEKEFLEALRLQPRYPEARVNLAKSYQFMGNLDAAVSNYQQALVLQPNSAEGHLRLGDVLLMKGQFREAGVHLRQALDLQPDSVEALGRLAWLLATHNNSNVRNGAEAVQLAEKACKLTSFSQAQPLNALAAAYAEVGDFKQAEATAERALQVAQSKNQAALVKMTQALLELYRAGKPCREGND